MSRESSIEGRELGAYRLDRRLGAGGIGAVYAATHVRTGRGYAVKVLLPEAADDATAAARFRREAEALAAVGHSGIVAVHDFDVTPDGVAYLVMDKLEGEDLDGRLARGPLSLAATLGLMSEVGSALAAAHDVGILHRDLKPSNIFLARRPGMPERAVLLDFGLAKLMEGEHAKLTATGATMGTPMYMSPEQAQGLVVDRRTDVYALGAVAFECLTARPPFDGPNVTAILAKVLTQPPPRLRDYDPSLPKGLEDVLVRTLSKDANERPPSVPALLAALHAAVGDAPSDRTPPAGNRPVPPTQATPMVVEVKRAAPNRLGWWIGGVAGLALLGAGVAVGLSWRDPGPRGMAPVVAPIPVEHRGAAPAPAELDAGVEAPGGRPALAVRSHGSEPTCAEAPTASAHEPALGRARRTRSGRRDAAAAAGARDASTRSRRPRPRPPDGMCLPTRGRVASNPAGRCAARRRAEAVPRRALRDDARDRSSTRRTPRGHRACDTTPRSTRSCGARAVTGVAFVGVALRARRDRAAAPAPRARAPGSSRP
ncbi:MAG: serine/threonine protein kinase [Sandaracinus sp.]|nr:serine/threonine protein kinase [Sandaracinus sp.]